MKVLDYLQNPYGKGSAIGGFEKTRKDYIDQYNKLQNKMKHKIYLYRNHAIYHIIVPSKVEFSDDSYDVIIEFAFNDLAKESVSVFDADFKIFSNCPSFVFTYANIFHSKKMDCTWLVNKYNKEVVKNLPTTRNSYGMIGPEKSIYLAMLYMKTNHIDRIDVANNTGIKVHSYSQISQYVRSQEDIMSRYKRKERLKKPDLPNTSNNQAFKRDSSTKVSRGSSRTKNVGKVRSSSKSKNTTKTKKI